MALHICCQGHCGRAVARLSMLLLVARLYTRYATRSPPYALMLCNDKHLIGVEATGKQLWTVRRDEHEILQMPVPHVGL